MDFKIIPGWNFLTIFLLPNFKTISSWNLSRGCFESSRAWPQEMYPGLHTRSDGEPKESHTHIADEKRKRGRSGQEYEHNLPNISHIVTHTYHRFIDWLLLCIHQYTSPLKHDMWLLWLDQNCLDGFVSRYGPLAEIPLGSHRGSGIVEVWDTS